MLKPPFSNAPNFSLPMQNGTFHLADLEGRNRVALFFPCSESEAQKAITQIELNFAGWSDRDLVLVLAVPGDFITLDLQLSQSVFVVHDARHEVAQRFGVSSGETAFFLLGKSHFPVTLAVDYLPDDAEIFALIDAMPMRQNEMRSCAETQLLKEPKTFTSGDGSGIGFNPA